MAPIYVINLIAVSAILFVLTIINPSLAVFVSIDCGFSGPSYKDENSIVWTGDDAYIHNIKESQVFQLFHTESDWTNSVRVFPSLSKNCYTIPLDKAGQRVLVRASFQYWSFDANFTTSPPIFDLHFDGNYWTTVGIQPYYIVSYEAIYVAKQNSTSICVAQTKHNQIPFISALELRSLDFNMYSHVDSNYALLLANRFNDGTNKTIRYPDDAYDRIWVPEIGGFALTESVKGEAVTIDTSSAQDNPPVAVLQDAVATTGTAWTLHLRTTGLPEDEKVAIYITAYFSEVIRVDPKDKRSLQVMIDDNPYSDPIVPPFGNVSTVYITNMTASFNNSFSVQATTDSTLPPLINAYEVYSITGPLTQGTDRNDVEGLEALQRGFDILQKWSGDPCLPSSFAWEWVECNTDASPRVTSLILSGFGLSGPLPDFSSMDALQTIDLHNNSLDGPIPDFLASFSHLKLLDLSENRLNGSIPTSLSNNKNLKLVVTGNCLTGMSCPPISSSPNQNPNDTNHTIPSSGGKLCSDKLQMILGAIIHITLLYFMFQ